MEDPATVSWGLSISDADFAKLKRGVRPRDMDDKWIFEEVTVEELTDQETINDTTDQVLMETELTNEELLEADDIDELLADETTADEVTLDLDQGGNISIRRSWSPNKELYRLAIKPSEGGTNAQIAAITWDQNQAVRISEEKAKINAVLLCRHILECDLAAAPDYDASLFSAF